MSFIDLETFDHIVVKASVFDDTIRSLQAAGRYGVECIVVWAGLPVADYFYVDTVYCPHQFATAVGARVASEDVGEMYKNMHLSGRTAIAQVHSHPGEAFHSHTDDDFSIVTRCGALSLVVPDFGFGEAADIKHWAAFRLRNSGWEEIMRYELISLEGFKNGNP